MYGLIVFFSIALWFFFIESYMLEDALHRGCVYSFWVFIYFAFYNSYKIIVHQLSRILALRKIKDKTTKWTFLDIKDIIMISIYILLYWIQVFLVIFPLISNSENIVINSIVFILISITITQMQIQILLNGIINIVKSSYK